MLTILINAYACGPGRGSEPGMAWNWCLNLARYCNLYIITEGEFREDIDRVLPSLKQGANMHFYFLPVSDKIRNMCWNQGDWRFYYYYSKWQKRALKQAQEIIKTTHIDVIHQLNMIGFREPGRLWKIDGIPLVWGPTNAKEAFPMAYLKGASTKSKIFIYTKNALTRFQLICSPNVHKMAKRAQTIVAASSDSAASICKFLHRNPVVINESGCEFVENSVAIQQNNGTLQLLWVGRYIFTKQLTLALESLAKITADVRLHIVGGLIEEEKPFKVLAHQLGIEDLCIWHERISHSEVQTLMRQCDLFFFTSVAEGTPHVVLESIANNLPVLCFDTCGHGDCVDDTVGIKIPLTNPQQSIKDFAEKIDYLYYHREELQRMSEGCAVKQKALSWESKALQMLDIYQKAISSYNNEKN